MFEFRNAKIADLNQILAIENAGFTTAEAATKDALIDRIHNINDTFILALDKEKVAGYINGPVVSKMYITDDLFETIQPNPTEGGFLSILGIVVAKEYRGQGLAGQLLQRFESLAKKHNRNGVTLTCRASLISFYEGYGYTNYGISDSTHGGVEWYNLIKAL